MTEKYEGWSITTDRGELTDLVTRTFKFGTYGWLQAFIDKHAGAYRYSLNIIGSEPFRFDKNVPLHSHDYHSLCNEGNDVLRGLFTEAYEYLMKFIDELPET